MLLDFFWAILIIAAYATFVYVLPGFVFDASEKYHNTKGGESFIWWVIAVTLFLLLCFIHIIHTLITIWAGYSALKGFRNWWHDGQ